MIFKNPQGYIVGNLTKNGVFKKYVKRSKHYVRVLGGWGISSSIIDELKKNGCTQVEIWDDENNIKYIAPLDKFIEKGIPIAWQDPQKVLKEEEFTKAQ